MFSSWNACVFGMIAEKADAGASTEALAGLVERVTYHNAESGFCVLRVKARGQRDLVTVVGHAASVSAGEWVRLSGAWVNDRAHGLQFRASFLKATQPTTREGIEKYLGSGMIRGIGFRTAELIGTALELELAEGGVVTDTSDCRPCVFLAGLYRAEQAIAEQLRRLTRNGPPWPVIEANKAIPWVQGRTGLALAPSQREAVRLVLAAKVLVITGGPGVGKTTGQRHPAGDPRQGGRGGAGRPYRPGSEATEREHRAESPHHPPAAGKRPRKRWLQAG